MALMTVQSIPNTGLAITFAAANSTDTFPVGANNVLAVYNGSGSTITATISTYGTDEFGNAYGTLVVSITTLKHAFIRLANSKFANPSGGLGTVTYSSVTTVTSALLGV